MSGPPVASRSTRRRATVTISVPEAARASRITSCEPNFPVPMMSRDENVRSPILSGSLVVRFSTIHFPPQAKGRPRGPRHSLRRHYPVQVRGSPALPSGLSARLPELPGSIHLALSIIPAVSSDRPLHATEAQLPADLLPVGELRRPGHVRDDLEGPQRENGPQRPGREQLVAHAGVADVGRGKDCEGRRL